MKNIAVSIRARLMNNRGREPFERLLVRYGNERLLYRLSCSPYRERFVLKGATLFTVWTGQPHRATRDIDLLGFGDNSRMHLEEIFQSLCRVKVEDDGLIFHPESVQSAPIRKEERYLGVRIRLSAHLTTAQIALQVDVGFGDAICPIPIDGEVPVLLGLPRPSLRMYRRETMVAEKFHAMVDHGATNSRMKDFYDICYLAETFSFEGEPLWDAIQSTFERRAMAVPKEPLALTAAFFVDPQRQQQWKAFGKKAEIPGFRGMPETGKVVMAFLLPALAFERPSDWLWIPDKGWQRRVRLLG